MKELIAVKTIGRSRPGQPVRVRAHEARVLLALGLAREKVAPQIPLLVMAPPKKVEAKVEPKVEAKKTETKSQPTYVRRDMKAED